MDELQIKKAKALGRCVFPVGSNQKRFARSMASLAQSKPEAEISEKQAKYIDELFHSYRRQMKGEHARLCDCSEAKETRMQIRMMISH